MKNNFNMREMCPVCGKPTSEFKKYTEQKYIDEILKQKILKASPLCGECKNNK